MTLNVAFLCSDGLVLAVDSMITARMPVGAGVLPLAHQHGVKLYLLPGPQLFSYSGDPGLAARFKAIAESSHSRVTTFPFAFNYPLQITNAAVSQFNSTGIAVNMIDLNLALGFIHGGSCHCCMFEGPIQPRMLDKDHYYAALGSGRVSAEPFLRFISDVFCQRGQPTVREAVFLAIWTVQHVIDVNPGDVAGPIRVAVFELNGAGNFRARELTTNEIDDHQQAIESARDALRDWRNSISGQSTAAAQGVPIPPTP